MKRLVAVALGCFLQLSSAYAENQLHFSKPIVLTPLETEELVAVDLDSDIYQATRGGYPDVRLLDSAAGEVAFLIRKKLTKVKRKVKESWRAEEVSLRPQADDGLEITFRIDLEKHPLPPQGVRLITPLRNFEHRVGIAASTDGQTWQPLLEDGLIFDYSQFMDVRNLALELPAAATEPRPWLRITIENVTQEQQSQLLELTRDLRGVEEISRTERLMINRQPFRIDRIELWHDEMQINVAGDEQANYLLKITGSEQDSTAQQTHVYLNSRREPLTRFTLVTKDRNFSRTARIEVRPDASAPETWRSIGSAVLTRIEFRSLQRESLEIELSEHRAEDYRLVIENRDSPPLTVDDVRAAGNVYEVVFLAQPGVAYRLGYSSPELAAPNFDLAALQASLAEGFAPLAASLGPEEKLEVAAEPRDPLIKRLLNNSVVLTSIIALLVFVLAVGLYRATRSLEQASEP